MTSCVEVVQQLIRWAGFSKEVAETIASDLRRFSACLYQGKWSRFIHWCLERNIFPCKATVLQVAKIFLYLRRELKLSSPAVNHQVMSPKSARLSIGWAVILAICNKKLFRLSLSKIGTSPSFSAILIFYYGVRKRCSSRENMGTIEYPTSKVTIQNCLCGTYVVPTGPKSIGCCGAYFVLHAVDMLRAINSP